ncbi:hypothetical protein [Streptomyces sp. NPDC013489]|uniref:hypothetical protein n=1 Tax=Streptomyces sp. NPDC013489 TaxID=3155606 RepID=UPI0033D01262
MHALRILPSRSDPTPPAISVPSSSPVPGLHVYRLPDDVDYADTYRWRIGHHSGVAVAIAKTEAHAVRGAREVADLADWTQDMDTVVAAFSGRSGELASRLERARCYRAGY